MFSAQYLFSPRRIWMLENAHSSVAQVLPGGQKPQSRSGSLTPLDQFITPAKTLRLFTALIESLSKKNMKT